MNMTTTEKIVCSFSNDELKRMIIAARMYNMTTGRQNDPLIHKLVDAFLMSNELESEVIKTPNRKNRMGIAEGKEYLATL